MFFRYAHIRGNITSQTQLTPQRAFVRFTRKQLALWSWGKAGAYVTLTKMHMDVCLFISSLYNDEKVCQNTM